MKLTKILQNAVVYTGLLAALNLSCGDGSDDSGSNGNVESVDAGYNPSEGGEGGYLPPPRKDAGVNYDDANEDGEGEDVGEGGEPQNLPPVVEMWTDKNEYLVGEDVTFYIKAEDPDCERSETCGNSKGIKNCKWKDNIGNSGAILMPDGEGEIRLQYGSPAIINSEAECCDKYATPLCNSAKTQIKILAE